MGGAHRPTYYQEYYAKHREEIRKSKRASAKKKYWENPDASRATGRERYWERKEKSRERRWVRQYGLSKDDYAALLKGQGGTCAICGAAGPGRKSETWCIDHDHETGEVRGLLCHACNAGLGHFLDSGEMLRRAADYLAHPPSRELDNA
jgi:hypothetical protein